jgi:hypothetical protein
MVPLTVDGLIYASSMVMLDSARQRRFRRWRDGSSGWALRRRSRLTWPMGLGMGRLVRWWPRGRRSHWSAPTNCYGGYRGSQASSDGLIDSADNPDPLGEQAAEIFADQLAADRVPSIRVIRAQLQVGQPPGAAAAGLPRHRGWGCKAGRKTGCMSKLRVGPQVMAETQGRLPSTWPRSPRSDPCVSPPGGACSSVAVITASTGRAPGHR